VKTEAGGALCRVCGKGPTIKAHLIPAAFARDIRECGPDMKVGSIDESGYQFSKSGYFDPNILCAACDGELGKLDDYAVNFCRTFEDRREMITDDMFSIGPVDTDKLVKFTASVYWRHSISSRPEAAKIRLGPFEESFQKISFDHTSIAHEPALIIWANRSQFNMKKFAFAPTMHRQYGMNFCSMILGGLSFVLKIDSRPLPSSAKLLSVNGKNQIVSGYKPFDGSYEFHEMIKVVRNMEAPRVKRQKPPIR
jgi:hypothetical protein